MSTPQLRFNGFEGKWQEVKGNYLFDSISDKKHNSDLPILAITQDQGAIPRELINYKVIVSDASVDSYKVVNVGDFIISLRSFQGGIEYSNYKGICSPAYIILRNTKEIFRSFYKIYFKTYIYISKLGEKLEGIRDGKMVSYKYFSEISIPYPSIQEQEKIASFFTVIDQKLNLLKEKREKLQLYKKGVMQQIFSQKLRFKDEKGNEFPEWEEKSLGEICEFNNGKAHENSIVDLGKYVVVNSKFISTDGRIKKYSDKQFYPLYKSDIVMVMSDVPNGKAIAKCYLIDEDNKYTLNQRICQLKSKKDLNPFLIYLLNRNRYFLSFDSGVGQTNLRKDEILECPLYIPSDTKEQQKIADFLYVLDTKINLVSTQIEKTELWKKGLLQQMFV